MQGYGTLDTPVGVKALMKRMPYVGRLRSGHMRGQPFTLDCCHLRGPIKPNLTDDHAAEGG